MVGSGTIVLLLALVLAPQIKASDNLATTFQLTAAVFVVIGTLLFATTFLTARETVVRDVAQVSLKQTIQTVTRNGPLMRLCLSSCDARYERLMRSSEAAGDYRRLTDWEARAEQARERRHRRRMDWISAPLDLGRAIAAVA